MRVGYLLGDFPVVSERFLLRELAELDRRGVPLSVYALRRCKGGPIPPEAEAFVERVRYIPPLVSWRAARAAARRALHLRSYLGTKATMAGLAVRSRSLAPRAIPNLAAAEYIADDMARAGVTHVHAAFASQPALIGLLVARSLGLPFSFAGHARDIFVRAQVLPEKIAAARFVNVCTEHAASHLRALCPEHADNIHTIYHGLDPEALPSAERRPTDPPTILAVGRLVPKKGFEYLIRACHRLAQAGVGFRCVIAGGGPLRLALETSARKLGLTQLTITGALPPDSVEALYGRASVFVCPSVMAPDGDRDGLPNVVLEAMAWRLPVVGTDVGGIPEAVAHERTGLIVPPNNATALSEAIERVLTDRSLAERLGDAGRRLVVERFSIRSNIEPLLRLF